MQGGNHVAVLLKPTIRSQKPVIALSLNSGHSIPGDLQCLILITIRVKKILNVDFSILTST